MIKRNKKIVRSDKEIKIGDNLIIEFFSDISKVRKLNEIHPSNFNILQFYF